MADYDKFLPQYPPFHQPFWDSLKAHEMRLQRCDDCGAFRFMPFELCRSCHSERSTWTVVSGRGEIYTYTVVHRAPTPAYQKDAPYVIVHVQTQEGPRMIGNLLECPVEEVRIGMPVEVAYEDVTPDLTLYRFRRPAELA